ncbi:hypothetical protein MTBBW1_1010004 [Desulfamplus magnetovallimortis]|uniref:Uncharacterized protein n=1 Tax=Desulfamplus magnetovallimortis TaxID=1246637 RepID=A0A1W1H4S8_9BACT|nr:hypothetical protein MTBBW1_1010004 [Desulfamplus magnetovallimortis]
MNTSKESVKREMKDAKLWASFISCRKYFTLFGTGQQKNRHCVQANVNWQMKDAIFWSDFYLSYKR